MFKNKGIQMLSDNNDGSLPHYAWPGGYPLYYFDRYNSVLCPACANNNDEELFPIFGYEIHWEGEPLICDECNQEIESAYGVPQE